MEIQLDLTKEPIPRVRPIYITRNGDLTKGYKPSKAVDFQDKLRHAAIIAIQRSNSIDRFPLSSDVSLIMDVSTNKDVNLIGVVKNTIDAPRGLLYSDDVYVSSFCIDKHYAATEGIKVSVLNGNKIPQNLISKGNKSVYSQLSFEVISPVVDKVIPIPGPNTNVSVVPEMQLYDKELREEIFRKYPGFFPLKEELSISIEIRTQAMKDDIDNIAINYILNMSGIVFESAAQITTLQASLTRTKDYGCRVTIATKDIKVPL